MITLNWSGDSVQRARHGAFEFTIVRDSKASEGGDRIVYSHIAAARERDGTVHLLGTHIDSAKAREACAEFINSKAGD